MFARLVSSRTILISGQIRNVALFRVAAPLERALGVVAVSGLPSGVPTGEEESCCGRIKLADRQLKAHSAAGLGRERFGLRRTEQDYFYGLSRESRCLDLSEANLGPAARPKNTGQDRVITSIQSATVLVCSLIRVL